MNKNVHTSFKNYEEIGDGYTNHMFEILAKSGLVGKQKKE